MVEHKWMSRAEYKKGKPSFWNAQQRLEISTNIQKPEAKNLQIKWQVSAAIWLWNVKKQQRSAGVPEQMSEKNSQNLVATKSTQWNNLVYHWNAKNRTWNAEEEVGMDRPRSEIETSVTHDMKWIWVLLDPEKLVAQKLEAANNRCFIIHRHLPTMLIQG